MLVLPRREEASVADELPNVLTPAEIATRERLHVTTVIKWCQTGRLRAYKIGGDWRIPRDAYEDMKQHNTPPPPKAPRKRTGKVPGRSRQAAAERVLDGAGV